MFQKARLKLTLWYIAIILVISGLFSVAFYNASTRELSRVVDSIAHEQQEWSDEIIEQHRPPPGPPMDELKTSAHNLLITLILINGVILVFSGGAAYVLAGRTLHPIEQMITEQNQFISNSSHELRTPLATLRAEMEGNLLEKHISDSMARNLITSNLEEVSSLQTLTNSLLDLAKIHSLVSQRYSEKISLPDAIEGAIKQVNSLAKKKHIVLLSDVKNELVIGDKDSLKELFVILLDNAIKYSAEKTSVHILSEIHGRTIQVKVKDEGIGISNDDLPYVFDRFYRSNKSRSGIEGFGLGLSIAKKIVEKHNGSIHVESIPNKGTAFNIEFPLV